MMKRLLFLIAVVITGLQASANYTTPGTGQHWNLDDLVLNSAGDLTYNGTNYVVNDTITISAGDTLYINQDITAKFLTSGYLFIKGVLLVDPPTGALFTTQTVPQAYPGVRIEVMPGSVIRKLTFEYGQSFVIADCSPRFDSCTFQYNGQGATTSTASINLFRSNPVITNCKFLNNFRGAISGGANISNAPQVYNCLFMGNNTLNGNVPQINLGGTGADTCRIINNQFLRASTNSGAIGFLPLGPDVRTVITGNLIRNNRYGITLNGGANINSLISYNIIDSNNTQGNPNLGGSGIAFSGGAAGSSQNSIVTGNVFTANLWGITIQGRSKPNLGNINNADTSDNGKNKFINNTNANTPFIDLFNNSVDPISAQNNYWGEDNMTPAQVEAKIYHTPDDPTRGLVDFSSYLLLPVKLISFNASRSPSAITLNWKTADENNSSRFEIERSVDGNTFTKAGSVNALGNNGVNNSYSFADNQSVTAPVTYYRLKIIDKDGRFNYSWIVAVKAMAATGLSVDRIYRDGDQQLAQISSDKAREISIRYIDTDGKILSQSKLFIPAGSNVVVLPAVKKTGGNYYVQFIGENFKQTALLNK
ncbi:MAG: hypothetical protein JWQ27_2150 [Ferruginibacter sp.]|nr:hypothetical protein [Ferruginibacter sp.]